MCSKKSVVAILLLLVCGYTYSQDTTSQQTTKHILSLAQAQQLAIDNNAEVVNSGIDVQIAKKKIWETTAIGLPQISAEGTFTYNPTPPTMTMFGMDPNSMVYDENNLLDKYKPVEQQISLGEKSSMTADITVSQLVFSGEYIVGLKASRTYKRYADEGYENAVVNMKETVAGLYYSALILSENINIIDSTLLKIENNYNELQKMQTVGYVQQTDVDQLKLNYQNLQNIKSSLSAQYINLSKFIKLTIGIDLSDEVELSDNLTVFLDAANLAIISEELILENHINYKMLQTGEDLAKLSWQQQKSKFLPTVAAFYKHKEYITEEPELSFEPKDMIGVSVSIPIFSSGQRLAQTSQAKMEYMKVQNTKEQTTIALQLAAEKEKNNYQTAFAKYQNEKDNMLLAGRIFDQTLIKQKNGMASSMDVATAQIQFLNVQQQYFNAVLDLLNSKVTCEKALGKL